MRVISPHTPSVFSVSSVVIKNCSSLAACNKFYLVKLLRAAGGCLGINRRRRTRIPAKSSGELEIALTRRSPNGATQRD